MHKSNYIISAAGGYLISLLGGIDEQLTALIVLMILDFISGFLSAIMGRSTKSPSGYLSSKAAGAGIVKKIAYLICVIVGVLLERATGLQFIRQVIIISFVVTETLSILENCRKLGITIPPVLYKALDIIRDKADRQPEPANPGDGADGEPEQGKKDC